MAKRILFLYISLSSGHQRAADGVREALKQIAPDCETFGVDSISYAYPVIGKMIARTYLEVLRHTPMIWDYLYDNPNVESATREIREVLNIVSGSKMKKLLKQYAPDAVVCTQAVPCSVLAAEKRRGKINLPLVAVITDFAIHSYWVYKEVDLYCVSSEEARTNLIKHGVQASRIVVTGIPISPSFLRRIPREQSLAEFNLDPRRPTLLIMGGSQGMGPLKELVSKLLTMPVQCMVTAGLNKDLFKTLHKQFSKEKRVRVLGYTQQVSSLMDACDILITKPGGLTSSEALAKGIPMIVSNPLPGQEERNARYLHQKGVAERADNPEDVASIVQTLLAHPQRLLRMQEKAKMLSKPYAAMEAARWIFKLVNKSSGDRGVFWGAQDEYDRIRSR